MKRLLITSVLVLLVTVIVYVPALFNGFVNLDDPISVVQNPHLGKPLSEYLRWAFTTLYFDQWHPLTWLSYRLDYAVWGLNPAGYHLSSVLLHALNAALVVFLAAGLIGSRGKMQGREAFLAAGLAGLFFGVHPVHVESVAWISERKDLVYALFWLLALMAYVRFTQTPGGKSRGAYYTAALMAFVCSLMGKSMAITLPAVLLLLDWYPLRRFRRGALLRVVVLEKVPFAAVAAAGVYVAYLSQFEAGALESDPNVAAWHKFWVAVRALGLYLRNIVAPVELVPFHPFPWGFDPFSPPYLGALAAILVVSAASIILVHRMPMVAAAWLFLLVAVSPTLGLVRFGDTYAADRYLYLPMLGPLMLVSGLAGRSLGRSGSRIIAAVLGAVVLLLSAQTVRQTQVWRDSLSLWRQVERHYPDDSRVLGRLAGGLHEAGALEEAVDALDRAIAIDPYDFMWRQHRGDLYMLLGHPGLAKEDYTWGMKLLRARRGARGRYAEPSATVLTGRMLYARGRAHEALQDHAGANRDYEAAARALPEDYAVHYYLAMNYVRLGRLQDALRVLDQAVSLAPDRPEPLYIRGRIGLDMGNVQDALADLRSAARMGFGPARQVLDARKTSVEQLSP